MARTKRIPKPSTEAIPVVSVIDKFSSYPSNGLTPQKLASILREADLGDISRQSELYEEMLEKDTALFGMYDGRKRGIMKREFQIMPGIKDDEQAKKIAAYVNEVFENIKNWRDTLRDILDAVPKGVSVNQIMWEVEGNDIWIEKFEFTQLKNFRFGKPSDPDSSLNEIRRYTKTDMSDGVELEPNKWVVATMKARSGHPSRTALLRTNAWMYLFKNFDMKSWVQFAELFGLPLRIGKYSQSDANNKEVLDALESALRNLATDASAMIPNTTTIEFVEAAQKAATASLHGDLADYCNKENSIAILGHTGGAISTPGRLGAENVAIEAIFSLSQADALALDYIISDQVIRPLVDFKFGIQDRYPYYKTLIEPPKDRKELVEVYDGAINRIGLPIAKKDVYADLGIRVPEDGEEVIIPRPIMQVPQSFAGSMLYQVMQGGDKKKVAQ